MSPNSNKKVSYLLGAGASFGTLPIVDELPEALTGFAESLKRGYGNAYQKNKECFFKSRGTTFNRNQSYQKLVDASIELSNEISRLASFDTLAKRLTIRKEYDRLRQIKAILTSFFMYEQFVKPISYRHDSFFASILGLTDSLPKNINVLSWNYDSQMEKAFDGYINTSPNNLEVARRLLGLKIPMGENNSWDGFNLVKINGTADFGKLVNKQFHLTESISDKDKLKDECVLSYLASKNKEISSNINFAWDSIHYKNYLEKICRLIAETEILVVIGYSFPYFNKDVDSKIIGSMNNLEKICIQDPNAPLIEETMKSLGVLDNITSFSHISNLKQFHIPLGT